MLMILNVHGLKLSVSYATMGVFSLSAFYYFGVISIISEPLVALLFKSSHRKKKKKKILIYSIMRSLQSIVKLPDSKPVFSTKPTIILAFSWIKYSLYDLPQISSYFLVTCFFFNLITASPCNYFLCCCNFPLVFFHSTLCGG